MAQRWGWVAENPARRVIPPSYKAGRKEVWGPSGLAMFLAGTTDHWAHPLWVTALATGARPGELCALQWKDVDLQAQVLTVSKSLQRVGGEYRLAEPKTRASVRSIALPDEAVQALLRQKGQQALWRAEAGGSWQEWGLVFTTRAGAPLHRSTVLHTLARECQRLGLPAITPHSLRHLHASLLLAQGVAIPTVSARLGHANPSITLSVYSHAITGQDAEAALAIGRALTG